MRWAKVTQSFTSFQIEVCCQMNHQKVLEFIKTSELCSFRFEELKNFIGLQLSAGIKHIFSWNMNCNVQLSYKYNESSTYLIISPLFGIVISLHIWIWKLVSLVYYWIVRALQLLCWFLHTLGTVCSLILLSQSCANSWFLLTFNILFLSLNTFPFKRCPWEKKIHFFPKKHPWRRSKGSTSKWSLAGTWGQNSSISSRRYTGLPDMWETNLQNLQMISQWHPQASSCNLQADCANNFSQNNSPQSASTTPASSQVWNLPVQYRHRCSEHHLCHSHSHHLRLLHNSVCKRQLSCLPGSSMQLPYLQHHRVVRNLMRPHLSTEASKQPHDSCRNSYSILQMPVIYTMQLITTPPASASYLQLNRSQQFLSGECLCTAKQQWVVVSYQKHIYFELHHLVMNPGL